MRKSFSLIEVILAVAIFALVAGFFIFTFIESYKINEKARDWRIATILAEEGVEAVRSIRDIDYNELVAQSRTYCLAIENNRWVLKKAYNIRGRLIHCLESIDKFNRQITITSTLRGRRIISAVSWETIGGLSQKINLYSLVTNWR